MFTSSPVAGEKIRFRGVHTPGSLQPLNGEIAENDAEPQNRLTPPNR